MASVLVTGPASEPVSLTEAKLHLRVDGSDEDTLISALIVAAREAAEAYTRRALVTQTWRYTCDQLATAVTLPHQPLQSVTSIAIDGETLASTAYEVDTASGRVKPLASYAADDIGGIAITYVAGYGAASDVPQTIRQAMLLMIGHWYEHREAVITGSISSELPLTAKALLAPYRVMLV
jgi:uncharacterized phiE125 gp8 family phage protein